jgi:hypothetical protein
MRLADHCCVLYVGLQGMMTAASGRGMLQQPAHVKMVPGEAGDIETDAAQVGLAQLLSKP